jgi:ADP-ribosylglycohydrolase
MDTATLNRYRGCLLGLAVGDALGTTVEFQQPGTFAPVTDMVGGGVFQLESGQWTDDTSMALCLAESLIEKETFDPADQLDRYWLWYSEGRMSSTGRCFDIGNATRRSLEEYHKTRQLYATSGGENADGNGSLMRLAPVPMFYARSSDSFIGHYALSSRTTHDSEKAADACAYFGSLLAYALLGSSKKTLWSDDVGPGFMYSRFSPEVLEVMGGSFMRKNPPDIVASGYVVATLEAALWAFYHSESFEEGALKAVNLGNDADTVGAVYGQLAGAYYGESGIPYRWTSKVTGADYIRSQANWLYTLSRK